MSKFYYLIVARNFNEEVWGDGKFHSLKEVKRILDNNPFLVPMTVYKVTKNHYRCIFDYDDAKIYVDTKQLYGKYINIPWNKRFN